MEQLFPGYTDVFIDEETCNIRKAYNGKPCTYFSDGKSIKVNLRWTDGKSHGATRQVSILTAYKKVFGVGFTGEMYAANGDFIQLYKIESGKITERTQVHKIEYFRPDVTNKPWLFEQVPHPMNNLAIR